MENVEDAKGLKPDEQGFDAMTAKFVDQLADGGRAGYFLGGNIEGGYSQSRTDSGGPQTTTTFNGGGNDNPPPVTTTGDGGITSVVTKAPELSIMDKFKGYFTGGPEEEEDDNLKNVNAISQKGSLLNNAAVTIDARTQANLNKAKELGFKKGGLAKILEL